LFDARAETQVIFIREEAVTERYDFTLPAISEQEVERNARSMIQLIAANSCHPIVMRERCARDSAQEFFIERSFHDCAGRAKVPEVSVKLRLLVSDEGCCLQRRMRRDKHDRLRSALYDAPRELTHRLNRAANITCRLASNFWNHYGRVRSDACKNQIARGHLKKKTSAAGFLRPALW
jgi:hypothetical protein